MTRFDLHRPITPQVSRQMHRGFTYFIFERSGLRKPHAENLKARQVDNLCDRFKVTAV